jgi:7-cyano-7-deazaguanine reductase
MQPNCDLQIYLLNFNKYKVARRVNLFYNAELQMMSTTPKLNERSKPKRFSSLAEKIAYLLQREGLHEAEFARKVGITQQVCNQILRGQTANPRLETLTKLASFFSVSVGQLVGSEPFEDCSPKPEVSAIPLLDWNQVALWVEDGVLPENGMSTLWISCDLKPGRRVYAIRSNPSFEPYFDRNAVLLIDPSIEYLPGHFVVANIHSKTITVRRLVEELGEFFLNSIVSGIPSIQLGPHVQLLGTVVEIRQSQLQPHLSIRKTKAMSHLKQSNNVLNDAPLGKSSAYINTYTPSLLFPIPRKIKRDEIGIHDQLPFTGGDIWTGYELSWLNLKGKPTVAIGEFWIPCESTHIIESKSLKLYLNSLSNSRFESIDHVKAIIEKDLSERVGSKITVKIVSTEESSLSFGQLRGKCLDDLDIECSQYMPDPSLLSSGHEVADEIVYSHLLKSNCLVTGQPDWGSIEIAYRGPKINHEGLLKYIVSLRDHNEFHEQCVERIFCDLTKICNPHWLSVYARYTRRGGLDINPYRVSPGSEPHPGNVRLTRQ